MTRSWLLLVLCMCLPSSATAVSPAAAARAAATDAATLPRKTAYNYRYLWWPPGWEHAALLTRAQQALLSSKKVFPQPVEIAPGLFRIDFRQSGWEKRFLVWEKFADFDPVFHSRYEALEDACIDVYYPPGDYDGTYYDYVTYSKEVKVKAGQQIARAAPWADKESLDKLRYYLGTEVPILMGPWWMVRVMRVLDLDNVDHKFGYYEWFGIKNRDDLLALGGVDARVAGKLFQEWRAWVKKSGISEQERIVGDLRGATGDTWFTLDVKSQTGRGQPGRNLLPGELAHDAEEWIVPLPSGLPLNGLIDAKTGNTAANAPDFIGGDRSAANTSNDLRIQPFSCWNCHGVNKDYIEPFTDALSVKNRKARRKVLLVDSVKGSFEQISSLYLSDIQRRATLSRQEYAYAIARLTSTGPRDRGLTVAGFARIYSEAYYKYLGDVTIDIAAAELGVEVKSLRAGLEAFNADRKRSDMILSEFMDDPPGTISRRAWEDGSYQFAALLANGIEIPEVVLKRFKK